MSLLTQGKQKQSRSIRKYRNQAYFEAGSNKQDTALSALKNILVETKFEIPVGQNLGSASKAQNLLSTNPAANHDKFSAITSYSSDLISVHPSPRGTEETNQPQLRRFERIHVWTHKFNAESKKSSHGTVFSYLNLKSQALCLFSIPEHHDQDGVFLIAAVGEWWSFRLVSRSDFEGRIFQDHLYDKLLQVKENEKEDNEDMTHLMGSSQTGDMEKYQAQMKEETPEEIRLRHKRERANRLSEREKTRIDWSQNQSDLQKLIDEAEVKMGEPGVYANEKMDEYSHLQSTLDRSWQRHWGTVFLEPDPASRSGLVDIKQQTEWSKVFRIGTQTSASYLDQISNELARLVEQTSLEDLPVADPIVESNQTEPSHVQPDRVRTQSRNRNSSRHDSSHPGSRNPSYGPGSRIPDRPPSTTVRARPGGSDTQALTRNSQTDRRAPSRPVSRAPSRTVSRAPSRAGSGAPSPAGSGAPSPAGSVDPSPAGSRDPSIDPGSRARNPLRSSRIQPGSSNIQRGNQDERTKPSR
ncbi:hypothetical protein DFH05DRAFT_1460033 [Lentinula detonsa]|uniref:Uncharacterized protein n=1 Tax=Lentinula detonsa TaxID=2804962 RepID=A0A9W8P1R3_9AGAR|nr:hypothetical protein DFH05DRAFT_1460033 [Lentinula detonsa]